ncbi:MAG: hypothetical protein K2X87_01255 [Gemmataceae bacterium]|nr:hypothetical protein [Gemmataceae bacterium]
MTRPAGPPTPAPDGPKAVSRFEYNLVCVLRFLLGHFPADRGLQLVRAAAARPPCLSATAADLVKDSLAKACVLFLVRAGGWRDERFLRDRQPAGGRAWDRWPSDERALSFSGHVVEFLLWATAERVHETGASWDAPPAELTAADELFFWLAFDACRADGDLVAVLRRKAAFRQNRLLWLTAPAELTDDEEPAPPDFALWCAGTRAVVLECLQPVLTARWLRSERAKGQVGDWRRMRHQGRAEAATLAAFLDAAHAAGRTDLARFVLQTNSVLFRTDLAPDFWTEGLAAGGSPGRLADRLDARRAALAVPRQMDTLSNWQAAARGVGYFDDDYAASQLWKQTWEAADGDAVAARAAAAVAAIDPLRSGQPVAGSGQQADPTPAG